MPERVACITLHTPDGALDTAESLAELERLTQTAGGEIAWSHVFKRPRPDAALFLGSGQVEEVKRQITERGLQLAVIDHELRPIQQRNLETALEIRVIDRTQLILDIFARHARTHEGKLQVELAQLSYLLPRLAGKGVELSRLGGGIGTRGPGETQLEHDRRQLRTRIAVVKRQLEDVKQTRALHRRDREGVPLPQVSLVGYTNAGKSALLRGLTGFATVVEDKLFATLDLATRKLILPPSQEVLLTDTVGFIRRLPHHLVAAFRGTLEEVLNADLLLHVIDISHRDWEAQVQVVDLVLKELGAGERPLLKVFNKIDLIGRAMQRRLGYQFPGCVLVSALTSEGLDRLKTAVADRLAEHWTRVTLKLPYAQGDVRHLLMRRGRLIKESFGQNGVTVVVELPPKILGQVQKWLKRPR